MTNKPTGQGHSYEDLAADYGLAVADARAIAKHLKIAPPFGDAQAQEILEVWDSAKNQGVSVATVIGQRTAGKAGPQPTQSTNGATVKGRFADYSQKVAATQASAQSTGLSQRRLAAMMRMVQEKALDVSALADFHAGLSGEWEPQTAEERQLFDAYQQLCEAEGVLLGEKAPPVNAWGWTLDENGNWVLDTDSILGVGLQSLPSASPLALPGGQ